MSDKTTGQGRGIALNLYNRFAELMLIVGLDENTGLVPIPKDSDSDCDDDNNLENLIYEQYHAQVLAAISASKALVFKPQPVEDPFYPPTPEAMAGMNSFYTLPDKTDDAFRRNKSAIPHRTLSVNPAVIKQHLNNTDSSNSKLKSVADLPLSNDAIESITTFCFPDNVRIYREKPDNIIHFLVLTNVSGCKTYACCLTFYKPYVIQKEENGTISFTLQVDSSPGVPRDTTKSLHCYIPQCCVLVSKYPYFYAMKESLSCMISHVERDLEEMYQFLKDFTYTMTMAPVPPAGNVIVEISLYNLSVSLYPSDSPEKPVIDLPLHLSFLCFNVDDLLVIFTAILCEERVVFVSLNYALLTTIMESFLYYILPFSWRFTYVPILSASSLELLEAPGTFMMGCHSKHLDVVEQVEGLVVVNIDEGTVSINTPSRMARPHSHSFINSPADFVMFDIPGTIPSLPLEPGNLFKKICKRAKFQMELWDVQRPFYYDVEKERAFRMSKCLQFNTEIGFAFLEMMVNLFRGTLSFLRVELRTFNKEQFIESIQDCDKPFYKQVLNTDMFKQFLEDRLNEKADYWSDYELKTRPYAKRVSGSLDISSVGQSHRQQMKPIRKQVSITTFTTLAPRTFEIFRLPALNDSITYTKNTINLLNKAIEECKNLYYRSSYIYLRGMFHAAEGDVLAALDDLLSLHAHNARLLPIELVKMLLQLIPESDREDVLKKKGVLHLTELSHELEHERSTARRGFADRVQIPNMDLSLEDFVETVSLLEMATDYDTIQRLFLVLAQPHRPTHVDKDTFKLLKVSYDENQKECEKILVKDSNLQTNEIILRVSSLIKTDFGMGRIVLTDKRLFYLKDVSNKYREIVKLRNILRLDKMQSHSFLNVVDTLVIYDKSNSLKFTAWLKEERNCWATLIEEMKAGKVVAEATKDFTVIGHAIQNVLLVDALIRSGKDSSVTHHNTVTDAAEALCYFTKYEKEGRHNLPRDTISALQDRVDPNHGQRERKTVEVMLYTAGSQSHDSNNPVPPRLWCGMGDGKVRVFDATNWTLEQSFVQTKNTVAALIAVGESQVWAGSHGIFIIETDIISCNKTLTAHCDLVADFALTEKRNHAYSGSVDGTIIMWEIQTLKKLREMKISNTRSLRTIKLYDNKLWCGTWQNIIALDLEGTQLQTFCYEDSSNGKNIELDCFEVFNDEIWAGCRRDGCLIVWDEKTTELKRTIKPECRGISVVLLCGDKVWVGTKDGTIYIYHAGSKELWKTIKAHDDAVRSMCPAESRYIMSGAGSKDGKVAIWNPHVETSDSEQWLKTA